MRTLRFEYLLTSAGFGAAEIAVDDNGRIAAVEAVEHGPWDGWIALPGMVNAHSHAFQRAMTGLAERGGGRRSFWGWRELMYRVAQRITPDDQYAIAEQAFREMLAAGFTAVGEFHYLHHGPDGQPGTAMAEAVIAAAHDTGIRLALLPVFYRRGGFDAPATPQQQRFVHDSADDFVDYVGELGPTVAGIAPHSLRAVDVREIPALLDAARARLGDDCVVHIHIAEQTEEVEQCRSQSGHGPIEWLCEQLAIDARWSLVHATHASATELASIVEADATVVLCPLTEAHLGDGIFPAIDYLAQGGEFAVGSDCNARIDAIEELRLLEYGQRLTTRSRPCLDHGARGLGAGLWAAAARGGARALNLAAGDIAPGRYADFVVLGRSAPLDGMDPSRALDAWLVGGSRQQITRVYVGGAPIAPRTSSSPAMIDIVGRLTGRA